MKKAADQSTIESGAEVVDVAAPKHEEALIDQAITETFPASDPISPAYEKSLEPVRAFDDQAERWRAWLRTATPYLIAGAAGAALFALAMAYTTQPRSRFDVLRDAVGHRVRRLVRH